MNPWVLYVACVLVIAGVGLWLSIRWYQVASPKNLLPEDTTVKDWEPTGKIDFCFPYGATQRMMELTNCTLLAEDRRIVSSVTGVEHNEIRWRKATPKEAVDVVTTYHKAKSATQP